MNALFINLVQQVLQKNIFKINLSMQHRIIN